MADIEDIYNIGSVLLPSGEPSVRMSAYFDAFKGAERAYRLVFDLTLRSIKAGDSLTPLYVRVEYSYSYSPHDVRLCWRGVFCDTQHISEEERQAILKFAPHVPILEANDHYGTENIEWNLKELYRNVLNTEEFPQLNRMVHEALDDLGISQEIPVDNWYYPGEYNREIIWDKWKRKYYYDAPD